MVEPALARTIEVNNQYFEDVIGLVFMSFQRIAAVVVVAVLEIIVSSIFSIPVTLSTDFSAYLDCYNWCVHLYFLYSYYFSIPLLVASNQAIDLANVLNRKNLVVR